MNESTDTVYAEEYFDYLHNRSKFRKIVRKIYLRDIGRYCIGKTIDFGCGVGQQFQYLVPGSIGFEVNKVAVDYCKSRGIPVELYDPEKDDYKFLMVENGKYTSFTMNHVLEHIKDSYEIITKIFESCNRLGIKRIVFTVPGRKGFQSDQTHVTFIDLKYFATHELLNNPYYKLRRSKYFPLDVRGFDRYFKHNELRLIFDKLND